jgi:hypothetical protein
MNRIKTFIFAGQSNMVGMGDNSKMAVNLRRIPENVSIVEYKTRIRFAEPWFGPEITFAHEISNAFPDEQILIIKFAIGSSSLLAWAPDWSTKDAGLTNNENDGPLYMKLLKFIDAVTVNMDPQFIALMWMQGERDSKFQYTAQHYAVCFKNLISQFRTDLKIPNLPVIYGQVNPPLEQFTFANTVRQAQIQTETDIINTKMVLTDDLSKHDDSLHYNTGGIMELGRRFATAFLQL